jgi:hypothetical protein
VTRETFRCDRSHPVVHFEEDIPGLTECPVCEVSRSLRREIEAAQRERDAALLDLATVAGLLSRHLTARQF